MSDRRVHRSGVEYPYKKLDTNSGTDRFRQSRHLPPNDNNEDIDDREGNEEDYEEMDDGLDDTQGVEDNLYSGLRSRLKEVENIGRSEPKLSAKRQQSKSGSNCFRYLCFFTLLSLALISGYFFFDGKRFLKTKPKDGLNEWQVFEKEFKVFEEKYSEVLPQMALKVLKISVKKVMNRTVMTSELSSVSPAVILLIASKEGSNVLSCIERDFVNTVNKAYNEENSLKINGKQYSSEDIVQKFDQNFNSDKKHTIVIQNIESIPPEEVMSLHQFTDHQNAKYKDVIIVFTAIHYENINLSKSADLLAMDSIATQLLQRKWKNSLREEQYFALISRLTTSVVTIIGEDNTTDC